MIYNKESAIKQMNEWGRECQPFLFVTDFELQEIVLLKENELDSSPIRFSFNQNTQSRVGAEISSTQLLFKPVPEEIYKKGFDIVMEHIHHGNSYLLNLTFPSEIESQLNLKEIYQISIARYKLLWEDRFTVFSPEPFVRIRNNRIYSHPMKGTIDADIPRAKQQLWDDEKELAEHYTIVDLIRNDLNRIAKQVRVDRFRYFDTIYSKDRKLLQTSSEISGELDSNWKEKIGSLLFELLPAGSVSGAPKMKTLEIIRAAETGPRGYYTGVFGFFDGNGLESGVMIRFIEQKGERMYYRSGGGITSGSNWELEYQELKNKIYVPVI